MRNVIVILASLMLATALSADEEKFPGNVFRLLDAGGTPDYYSMPLLFRGDGMVSSTGAFASERPKQRNLHGRFIDTKEKVVLWP